MRIEFWGEGNAFPTAKRLKADVIQNYEGTNVPIEQYKINCKGGKPNWTLVIPQTEVDANVALQGNNNPDPTAAPRWMPMWPCKATTIRTRRRPSPCVPPREANLLQATTNPIQLTTESTNLRPARHAIAPVGRN